MHFGRAAFATTLALATLSGCNIYRPGGSMRSNDTFTFISNEYYPVTVTIVDVRTNEPIWTADVPVSKQLTFRFHEAQYPENPANPDAMRWQFFDRPTRAGELNSVMACPDKFSRRMDVTIRKVPEYATGSDPRVEHAGPTQTVRVTPGTPVKAPAPQPMSPGPEGDAPAPPAVTPPAP
ncbi:MAG: hypothetical protein ACREJD_12455 [Phycisphaerales bacterium]